MQLLSVEIEEFRVIRGPLRLELAPGLNVLHGPNEVGKSTVVEAIWQALVLPSRSETELHKSLLPRRGGNPRVKLVFEQGGDRYTLEKLFAGRSKGRCSLRIDPARGPAQELSGPEAEERVRQALGVGEVSRSGELDGKLSGYWRLLRVTQGRSGVDPAQDLVGARDPLANRLAALSGEVLAGAGAGDLIQQVETEYLRHFTAQGKEATREGAPVASAQRALAEAQQQAEALKKQLDEHDGDVDRHERLTREASRLRDELPRHRERHQLALSDQDRIKALKTQLVEANNHEKLAASQAEGSEAQRHQREQLVSRARLAQEAMLPRAQAQKERHDTLREAEAMLPEREAEARLAEDTVREAERRERRVRACRELSEAQQRRDAPARALAEARAVEERLRAVEKAISAERLRPEDLKRLERLERDQHTQALRLEAAAAGLRLRALSDCTLEIDGESLKMTEGHLIERSATETLRLRLPGLLELELRPGGEDLSTLRRVAQGAERALKDALGELGLLTLDEARARLHTRQLHEQEQDSLRRDLARIAPKGAGTLERALSELELAHTQAEAELRRLSRPEDPPLPEDPQAARASLSEAELATREARDAAQAAERARAGAQERVSVARAEHQNATLALAEAERQRNEAEALLTAHRDRWGEDLALQVRAEEHRRAAQAARAARESRERELDDQDPSAIELELRSSERALRQAQESLDLADNQRRELEGKLSAAGAIGLHERLSEAQERVKASEERLADARAEAEAARLLYSTLIDCRREAQERTLAPLTREVQTLLRTAFPEAKANFNQSLALDTLDRGDKGLDPFDALSAGAREQLGLVLRLAMARLLAGDERLLVVLDDALVASDEDRLGRMRRVLDAAATKLQILFVTCHWERLRGLGVVPDRLIDLEEERRRQERGA